MASSRDIKQRIRSVKNIAQITKAMEVVSMTKMRKSQQFALNARPYAMASITMLQNILKFAKNTKIPLLTVRAIKSVALVVVTTDKGLVGGFNDSVIVLAEARKKALEQKGIVVHVITVGRKAKEYFDRKKATPVFHVEGFGDYSEFSETKPVADAVLTGYQEQKWDEVHVFYTHFKSTLRQVAHERKILPTTEDALEEIISEIIPETGRFSELRKEKEERATTKYNYKYTFEPSPEALIEKLVQNLLRTALHHLILESNASEHSARMVTMKSASDNAGELKDRLTLQYNKVRQASITAEISEIVAGAEALQ